MTIREQILDTLRCNPHPARALIQQIDAQPGVVSRVLQMLKHEKLVVLCDRRWHLTEAGQRVFIVRHQRACLLRLRLDVERLEVLAGELESLHRPWIEATTIRTIVLQALSEGPQERCELERRARAVGYAEGGATVVLHRLRREGRADIIDRGGRWRSGVWVLKEESHATA